MRGEDWVDYRHIALNTDTSFVVLNKEASIVGPIIGYHSTGMELENSCRDSLCMGYGIWRFCD